jgi:hypothetical protein
MEEVGGKALAIRVDITDGEHAEAAVGRVATSSVHRPPWSTTRA